MSLVRHFIGTHRNGNIIQVGIALKVDRFLFGKGLDKGGCAILLAKHPSGGMFLEELA